MVCLVCLMFEVLWMFDICCEIIEVFGGGFWVLDNVGMVGVILVVYVCVVYVIQIVMGEISCSCWVELLCGDIIKYVLCGMQGMDVYVISWDQYLCQEVVCIC